MLHKICHLKRGKEVFRNTLFIFFILKNVYYSQWIQPFFQDASIQAKWAQRCHVHMSFMPGSFSQLWEAEKPLSYRVSLVYNIWTSLPMTNVVIAGTSTIWSARLLIYPLSMLNNLRKKCSVSGFKEGSWSRVTDIDRQQQLSSNKVERSRKNKGWFMNALFASKLIYEPSIHGILMSVRSGNPTTLKMAITITFNRKSIWN